LLERKPLPESLSVNVGCGLVVKDNEILSTEFTIWEVHSGTPNFIFKKQSGMVIGTAFLLNDK
jgi:hypothetical protein